MSDFRAKMHQIQFRVGLSPRPHWGAYSAPPDLLAEFKGPTSKRREGKGWGMGREKGRGGKERKGEGREVGSRREGAPIEMKAPSQNPKYATGLISTKSSGIGLCVRRLDH